MPRQKPFRAFALNADYERAEQKRKIFLSFFRSSHRTKQSRVHSHRRPDALRIKLPGSVLSKLFYFLQLYASGPHKRAVFACPSLGKPGGSCAFLSCAGVIFTAKPCILFFNGFLEREAYSFIQASFSIKKCFCPLKRYDSTLYNRRSDDTIKIFLS